MSDAEPDGPPDVPTPGRFRPILGVVLLLGALLVAFALLYVLSNLGAPSPP